MATRRTRFDPTDPADLRPDQRRREVAAILAVGFIRARLKRRIASAQSPQSVGKPQR